MSPESWTKISVPVQGWEVMGPPGLGGHKGAQARGQRHRQGSVSRPTVATSPRCCSVRHTSRSRGSGSEGPQDSRAGDRPRALATGPAFVQVAAEERGQMEMWGAGGSMRLQAPSQLRTVGAGRRQQEPGQESGRPKEGVQGNSQWAVCTAGAQKGWKRPGLLGAGRSCR